MKEDACYKGVYCGLCHQMGREYGLFSRFVLSYDLTFLALLTLGMQQESAGECFEVHRCPFPPFRQKHCPFSFKELSTIATIAMLLFYYKVKDNQRDAGALQRLRATLVLPAARLVHRKARQMLPQMDRIMADCMREDARLSEDGCDRIDPAAEPTAKALAEIVASFADNQLDRAVLSRLGYLVGKYVYLMDAADDWEQDAKTGDYNVLVTKFGADRVAMVAAVTEVLNLTVAEIARTYELLTLHRFQSILDNIIYLGLHHSMKLVLASGDVAL